MADRNKSYKNEPGRTVLVVLLTATFMMMSAANLLAQKSEVRDVRDFDAVKASHGIEVELVAGKMGEVIVEARYIDLDDISTYVDRGVLRIRYKNIKLWDKDRHRDRSVKVTVPFEELTEVVASTGSIIRSRDPIKTADLYIDADMGGEVDLKIEVDELRAEFTMGSVSEISGRARKANIRANMGAVAKMEGLEAEMAYVKANMGAEVSITVTREIDAVAIMGAVISVHGNPEKTYTSDSFGGEVYVRKVN